jgi:hypothetical protein
LGAASLECSINGVIGIIGVIDFIGIIARQ